ncbi:restriction endonuclease subunit S [Corynebacterium amycolatum]|uniref:restriction endonuclease subunit S n=1 Tax=Corynebacterium amycolatum TaxID=43765 RepID=UPI000E1AF99E|nr:restriction endonuclease subunit S [Corynebacterium amycolatum]MDC7116104.1 restriction endonuclease subunit S [Corynebacterium amycolatum]STB94663.1 type I restriction-modification system, specificity subunit [Corynebacterium amycolatum]
MSQWPMVKLGDVANINMGQSPKTADINSDSIGTPVIGGMSEFTEHGLDTDKWTTTPSKICKEGDIILSIRATIGPHRVADKNYCIGRGVCAITPKSSVDADYLRSCLTKFRPYLIKAAKGATFLQVTKTDVNNLQIPFPPLEKQAEIAEVLRNSAQQITLQQNSIKQTSSICSNYYSLIQKDNYPELSLMNAGITKTSGKSITAKGNDPHETNRVLKVNAVSSGSFKPEESKPLPKSYSPHPSHSVCYGDLLFARASGTAALLGACTIVDKTVDNIFLPDKIWNLHTNGSPISKFYLLEALRSNNFRKIAESQFSSSTGVKNIKTSVLMNFAVKVPPPDTLNKFNQVFKYTASIIQKQKEKLALLEELHQSLATRAFAGQL